MEESNYIIDIINSIIGRTELIVRYHEIINTIEYVELCYELIWNREYTGQRNHRIITANAIININDIDITRAKLDLKKVFDKAIIKDIIFGEKTDLLDLHGNRLVHFPDIIEHIKNI